MVYRLRLSDEELAKWYAAMEPYKNGLASRLDKAGYPGTEIMEWCAKFAEQQ
jgi:hypothetical protein